MPLNADISKARERLGYEMEWNVDKGLNKVVSNELIRGSRWRTQLSLCLIPITQREQQVLYELTSLLNCCR